MIKVLHVIASLDVGGAEMMLYKLAKNMNKEQVKFEVITLLNGGALSLEFEALGVHIHRLDMQRGPLSFLSLWKFFRILQRSQPQVIQGWMYHGNIFAILGHLVSSGVLCFWSVRHCVYDLSQEKRLTKWIIQLGAKLSFLPNAIIYNSELSRQQHEYLGYRRSKSIVIPNGFDTKVFKKDDNLRSEIRRDLGISEGDFLVGMIGRFHPMKDHHNFIKAARIIVESRDNVYFLLAGREVDDDNSVLAKWVHNMPRLSKHLFLLGERQDIAALNAAMDMAVLSSSSEAFPNVLGEAMATSTPCVTTDVGDAAYLLGDTGVVVPAQEPEKLAEGIESVLNLPLSARQKIGEKARERIEDKFSIVHIVRQYEKLYTGKDN